MMGKTLLLLGLTFCMVLHSNAQGKYEFVEVVEAPGKTKDALYNSGRQFISRQFVSMKDVTQVADKESGEMTVKGIMYFTYKFRYMGPREVKMRCNFRFSLYVKDGKYKYEVTDFTDIYNTAANERAFSHLTTDTVSFRKEWGVKQEKMDKYYNGCKEGLAIEVNAFIQELKKAMDSKPANEF